MILHMCTINDNHMMYGSWNMEHDRQNALSFWTIFCTFVPLTTPKMKILWRFIILHNCNNVNSRDGYNGINQLWIDKSSYISKYGSELQNDEVLIEQKVSICGEDQVAVNRYWFWLIFRWGTHFYVSLFLSVCPTICPSICCTAYLRNLT